jgi:hypothetical protein
LQELTHENDLVITMGAGDVWKYGKALLDALDRRGPKPLAAP